MDYLLFFRRIFISPSEANIKKCLLSATVQVLIKQHSVGVAQFAKWSREWQTARQTVCTAGGGGGARRTGCCVKPLEPPQVYKHTFL